ncbi:SdpI family protein [Wenyingzhuangia sp. IMCC45574]
MLLLIIPPIFLITGLIMYKFPPKNINFLYGYKTPRSMKNQESWDFAQIYSAKKMMLIGGLLCSLGLVSFLLKVSFPEPYNLTITLLAVAYLILDTEITLKRKFK